MQKLLITILILHSLLLTVTVRDMIVNDTPTPTTDLITIEKDFTLYNDPTGALELTSWYYQWADYDFTNNYVVGFDWVLGLSKEEVFDKMMTIKLKSILDSRSNERESINSIVKMNQSNPHLQPLTSPK